MTVVDRVRGDYRKPPRTPLQALPLRDYQREALDAAVTELLGLNRTAIVLPTGAGKTVCFAHQSLEHLVARPADRVLVLVHTDELAAQALAKIRDVAPHLKVGLVKGTSDDVFADVIVASRQTLGNAKRRARITGVSLVIVDECHHATSKQYMDILTHFGCFDGRAKAVGYTATLMRGDGASLGAVWQSVALVKDISWMIRQRYLVRPYGKAVEVPDLDLRKVKSSRTDYREGELGEALADSLAPQLVAEAYLEHASGRRAVGFAPTVASAEVFADAFAAAGVDSMVVHGGLHPDERRRIIGLHKAGAFPVLWNCMILTEGYDDPQVSCIIVARPTKSKSLYVQIVGRGLRVDPALPWEDQDCLVLDVAGASADNDLRSLIDLSEKPLDPKKAHTGRTLTDLEDELDAGPGVPDEETQFWTGPTITRDFDPLGRPTTRVWLKTAGGTYFVAAGKELYVFIMEYPAPGQWSVCMVGTKSGKPSMTEHAGLPLDQALVWAGDLAEEHGVDLNTGKGAPWRRKFASDALQDLARNMGLTPEGHTDVAGRWVCTERAGDLSDRVSLVKGTRRIDPIVAKVRSRG